MKISRAIATSLGFAILLAISACKDDPSNLRGANQNPPRPAPGPGMGFVTNPQKSNSSTNSQNEDPTTTNTASKESTTGDDK